MNDELEVLEPSGSSVTYRKETLEIVPLNIGQLPKLVRAARPVIDTILALESLPADDSPELVTLMMDLIEYHSDQVFTAASICTGKPVDWLEGGPIDEFVNLAQTVFEVNRDFFTQKLAPLLAARAGQQKQQLPASGNGPTASSSSSSEGTRSSTSRDTRSRSSGHSRKPPSALVAEPS